jgi:hypothetical protein
MPAPRKPCPYTAESLRAAILEANGIKPLSLAIDTAEHTIRRWCKDLGVDAKGSSSGHTGDEDVARVKGLPDAELEHLVESFGAERASHILGISVSTVRAEFGRRGIKLPGQATKQGNPRAAALATRVRELEKEDAALRDLADAIRGAAQPAPVPERARVVRVARGPVFETPVDVILHVSDMQFGEVVHGEEVPGGRYSPSVFEEERLPRWLDGVDTFLQGVAFLHPVRRLWIVQGGDFCEGHGVFKGQEWHLAIDAGQQVVTLSGLWAPSVARVAETAKSLGVESVAITGVVGNHGVHGGRSAGAVPPTLSYDWLCYEMTRLRLEGMGAKVDFIDPTAKRAVYFEAAGHIVLVTHGDQDRGGGLVGVPVVTGLRNDLRVRQQTGLNHRYHLKGHYHVPTDITVGGDSRVYWNGDWCGANNLSTGRGGGSEPTQRAYVVHPEYGVMSSHDLRLAPGMSREPPAVLAVG